MEIVFSLEIYWYKGEFCGDVWGMGVDVWWVVFKVILYVNNRGNEFYEVF